MQRTMAWNAYANRVGRTVRSGNGNVEARSFCDCYSGQRLIEVGCIIGVLGALEKLKLSASPMIIRAGLYLKAVDLCG